MIRKRNVVEDHLDSAFATVLEGPSRPRSLRVSSLPYCPILDFVLPRESEHMDFGGACYTTMGTYVHENIQFFMSLGSVGADVWGGWECTVCKRQWKNYCFRPKPCCNQPLKYVEVTFRLGPLSGHCDLIVCYRSRAQRRSYDAAIARGKKPRIEGRWVAYEFKTIGAKPREPKRQHVVQIRTYAEMLHKCYGIPVDAYTIVYIGRQNLTRTVFGPYSTRKSGRTTREWMWRSIKGFKAATQALKNSDDANLRKVIEYRPCRSKEDYEGYMARHYEHSVSTCPMLPHCSRGDKSCLKAIKNLTLDTNPTRV